MKKALLVITISAMVTSCSEGRWIWGNEYKFKKREWAKKEKADRLRDNSNK